MADPSSGASHGAPPAFVAGEVAVQVPATSANLGPGFDSLGLALTLYDVVTAEVVAPAAADPPLITVTGECADQVPRDASHLVHRSMMRGFDAMGLRPAGGEGPGRGLAPRVRLHCENGIPHGRGLGSSSAAIVAGLSVARALVEDGESRLDDDALFALAADLEGHPDNVAPAVYGGFTIAYADHGAFRAVKLEVTAAVSLLAYVPPDPLATAVARGLLPAEVPHAHAAHSAGRAALLVAALTSSPAGRRDLLLAATEDRLHQGYRAGAMPGSAALVTSLRDAAVPAVVSGAGPTVLALVEPAAAEAAGARVPEGWRVLRLDVDRAGVRRLG